MVIQNTSSDMSIFYLLSNNYINDLIVFRFDFSNEDMLATYISFLKGLSLRLNDKTIQVAARVFFPHQAAAIELCSADRLKCM